MQFEVYTTCVYILTSPLVVSSSSCWVTRLVLVCICEFLTFLTRAARRAETQSKVSFAHPRSHLYIQTPVASLGMRCFAFVACAVSHVEHVTFYVFYADTQWHPCLMLTDSVNQLANQFMTNKKKIHHNLKKEIILCLISPKCILHHLMYKSTNNLFHQKKRFLFTTLADI